MQVLYLCAIDKDLIIGKIVDSPEKITDSISYSGE